MPEEPTRKQAFSPRPPTEGGSGFVPPPDGDPGTEPTISNDHADAALTQPTRVDPDAPIHRGAVASENSRPTTRSHVALPVGYALQEYTIEALLGSGGFGLTYLARDNNLQCQVAIKEYLPNDLAVRSGGQTVCPRTESDTHGYRIGLDGFLAEARVLATFRHPNIVRVRRFFEANNTAYMVMDYEKGEPLRDWVKRHGPIDEAQLLKMFLPLLEGLEVVHKAHVLHRDIKPANIYVREADGSLVLLDFGAARYARSEDSRSLTSMVTPGFAPFEQYHTHGAQGPWSDLYAFGGVLYWVVSGERPLEAPSRVRSDTMPPAVSLAKGRYSERLLRAIDWALTPDEADRPKSVSQFRAVLIGQADVPPPISAVAGNRDAEKPPARLPLFLAAAGVAVMVLVGIVFYPKAPNPPPPVAAAPTSAAAVPSAQNVAETEAPKPATGSVKKAKKGEKAENEPPSMPAAAALSDKPKEKAATAATGTVILSVNPQGEIVLDGRKLGTSPPLTRLSVTAGVKHKIEIHGSGLPHYWTVKLEPGEKREISANFEKPPY